jgi:hypothetical protein
MLGFADIYFNILLAFIETDYLAGVNLFRRAYKNYTALFRSLQSIRSGCAGFICD